MTWRGAWEFFASRWRAGVPVRTVLWRDMLGVGTLLNVLATFLALVMVGTGLPAWAAALVHMSPLPYNVFLFAAVARARPRSAATVPLALAWLLLMMVV